MLNIADLNDLEQLIEKIDLGLIIKICLEVIFYFAALFVAKKLIDIFFNKVVSKSEIPKLSANTTQFSFYAIRLQMLFCFSFLQQTFWATLALI